MRRQQRLEGKEASFFWFVNVFYASCALTLAEQLLCFPPEANALFVPPPPHDLRSPKPTLPCVTSPDDV